MTKSIENCGFGHIYWRYPQRKTLFFVQCILPIEKTLTFHNVTILVKPVLKKNKFHYYFNIFLEKCSYDDKSYTKFFLKWIFVYYKCYISIELTFLKELMLIKQANQKSRYQRICGRHHDLVMMSD